MKEIGSFIELEFPKGREWYAGTSDIARLNTGRAAIWHAFRLTGVSAIWIPHYQCESVPEFLQKKGCKIKFYHQDKDFNPIDLFPLSNEAVLLVNYFGVMSAIRMSELAGRYKHTIIDNCQAFFSAPVKDAFSVYSARKFVGVPDGAYVIGNNAEKYQEEYPQCYSSDTSAFLLQRIEYGCEGKGYESRSINENRIDSEDAMRMSALTRTILDGTDYARNKQRRLENFRTVHSLLGRINCMDPCRYMDKETVPMVYPLVVEKDELLEKLLEAKHFQGRWWAYITKDLPEDTMEYWLSRYMIPITIDQRYGEEDIRSLCSIVKSVLQDV